jgi:CRISPR-associated protein Csx14
MSNATPTISVPVDVTNPGQFFACCGLFELADRLWPGADIRAHFGPHRFYMTQKEASRTVSLVLSEFAGAECDQLDPHDDAASALMLRSPFNLRLDWWAKSENNQIDLGGGGQLKTWAGKQLGPTIFGLMKVAAGKASSADSPLNYVAPVFDISGGKVTSKTISPFYFDSRREGTCLDIGFSPDEQSMSVDAYPAVESLALVGLQRFRPLVDDTTSPRSFVYTCWTDPLPASVAALAACGLVPTASCGAFRFTKPSRGGEYLTMFSRATRTRSSNV